MTRLIYYKTPPGRMAGQSSTAINYGVHKMASKRKLKIQIKGAKEKKKRSNSTGCLAGLSGLAQCAHTQPRQEALRPAQELDPHFHYTHTRGILLPIPPSMVGHLHTCRSSPFFFLLIHVVLFVSSVLSTPRI